MLHLKYRYFFIAFLLFMLMWLLLGTNQAIPLTLLLFVGATIPASGNESFAKFNHFTLKMTPEDILGEKDMDEVLCLIRETGDDNEINTY